jgi:hypothetical protein
MTPQCEQDDKDTAAGLALRVVRGAPSKASDERWRVRSNRLAAWLLSEWERERVEREKK